MIWGGAGTLFLSDGRVVSRRDLYIFLILSWNITPSWGKPLLFCKGIGVMRVGWFLPYIVIEVETYGRVNLSAIAGNQCKSFIV